MKKLFRTLFVMFLLVAGTTASWADFTDFKLVLAKGYEGCLVTDEEFKTQYTPVEFGYVVNSDGTVSRVAKDDPTSMGTIKGKSHSEHGITNFEMTVKVDGSVKVGMSTCNWGGDVKINGVSTFNTNVAGKCWHQDTANNIAYGHYAGEAGIITIAGGSYTAYVSVEKEEVTSFDVKYDLNGLSNGSKAPEGVTVVEGNSFTIPANYTVYVEGNTLAGWTDGENVYKIGDVVTPTKSITLYPVFDENSVTLADRTDAVTLVWDFQTKNGAPTMAYQGSGATGFYVTQAVVNGKTIDVKLDFDATSGKIANANWTDWCQMNGGTKFTIPSCKGATVSIESYSATTTTTIDGMTDYTANGNVVTAEIGNKAESIDIVIGDGSYFRYIKAVLPVVAAPAGKTYTNEPVSVTWAMNDQKNPGASEVSADDVFSTVAFDYETNASITGTRSVTTQKNVAVQNVALKIQPKTAASDIISWQIKPAAGLTFTPTHITGLVNRDGTDVEKGITISVKSGDNEPVVLGTYTAWRAGKDASSKTYDATAIYEYDITLTAEQQAALATADMFFLRSTVGVGNTKNAVFGQVKLEGVVNGTLADVNKYTVNIAAAPADGGSVTIYPKSDEYVEGDEITLTATENFGYDFVNWTNAAGDQVSAEPKFKTSVTADDTFTANFVKVETYELAVAIDGGANDYMISYTPAPTIVDEKMMYEAGTKVTIAASENPILTFNNWSNGETNKETVVTMDDNVSLTANYSAIDFIVGWDFYQTGGRTRVADFIGNVENEASLMDMIDASGASKGFYLRPYNNSYEGKTCALNWNALAEKYYFQTMINTNEFSNIKIQSQMMYNYNAWTVQNLEASLDGETWETITSQDLGGTKNWQSVNGTLPAKYEHQPKVYLRWIPDYTSAIKGTESANDGTCLTNVYVIADKELVNDGIAPVLVSTVPAEGADNASANGKVVLTFDEKVKVAEGAKAVLSGMALTAVVSGKTVSFEYKGLEYSTAYVFTLPANMVADLTDNYMAEAITVNFQTKVKPSVEKGLYDAIVSNGEELKAAIKAANARKDQSVRYRIFVKKGAHVLPTEGTTTGGDGKTYDDPRTTMTASNVSIIGEDYETTSFTNITPAATWDNGYGAACPLEGIGAGDVLINKGTSNYFQGITIRTSMGDAHGRDIAFNDQGNKTIFKDARLWGYQDTYVSNSNKSRFYFENGVIRGRTDYICGKGDVWYEQVTFQQIKSGYLAVPSQPTKYGYILNKCTVVSDGTGSNDANGSYTLGRPWGQGTPTALYLNCVFNAVPSNEGWSEMSGGYPARFAEYNSVTANGTVIDLSKRKVTFGEHPNCNNPVLSAAEASEYSIAKVMGDGDDWDPTAYTEQASAPQNVVLTDGKTLSWDNSNYVFCWAVIKNGDIVDFTTAPTFTVDDATATWSVRAANEMGGLSEATVASSATAITEVAAKPSSSVMYNISGQRVNANAKGIVLQKGQKYIVK